MAKYLIFNNCSKSSSFSLPTNPPVGRSGSTTRNLQKIGPAVERPAIFCFRGTGIHSRSRKLKPVGPRYQSAGYTITSCGFTSRRMTPARAARVRATRQTWSGPSARSTHTHLFRRRAAHTKSVRRKVQTETLPDLEILRETLEIDLEAEAQEKFVGPFRAETLVRSSQKEAAERQAKGVRVALERMKNFNPGKTAGVVKAKAYDRVTVAKELIVAHLEIHEIFMTGAEVLEPGHVPDESKRAVPVQQSS